MSSDWLLEELGVIVTGKTPPQALEKAYFVLGTPFLTPKDMDGRKWITSTERYLSEAGLSSVKNSLIPAGSISVSCIGSDMGKAVMVPVDTVTNQQINSIIPDKTKCHPEYLYYLLSTKQQELKDIAGGSATPILNKGHFGKIQVHLPDIGYQAAAAKILSSFDDKIQLNNQINQTLEQMAQAIFKSWFVDFEPTRAKIAALEAGGSEDDALLAAMQAIAGSALFATDAADADAPTQLARLQTEHPEQYATLRATAELFPSAMQESELGEIPEGWEASTLSDFCEFQNGYAFKGKDWADSGFPVVKIGSVKPGFVDLTKVSYVSSETVAGLERFELKAGDILVGMTGYPGETGLVPNYADRVFLNQRVGRFIPNEKYLYAYIFSAVRDSEFKVFVESQAHGSAQANISGKAILQYPLISGSKNLMMRFYEVVNPQIQQMICLNAESSQLGELRDTLLPKLLSGEITLAEEVKRS